MSFMYLNTVEDLSNDEIYSIVEKCSNNYQSFENLTFKNKLNKKVALVFMEPSSRTKLSFISACQKINRKYLELERESSSLAKGESLFDTVFLLKQYDVGTLVLRSSKQFLSKEEATDIGINYINAGLGINSHPTQVLLDLSLLCLKYKGIENLKNKNILVYGDIKHSRVAMSWFRVTKKLDLNIAFSGPSDFKPEWVDDALWVEECNFKDFDIVYSLRIQQERFSSNSSNDQEYIQKYQVSSSKLSSSQFLMHPGPVVWGLELCEDLKNYSNSLILEQIKMGYVLRTFLLANY